MTAGQAADHFILLAAGRRVRRAGRPGRLGDLLDYSLWTTDVTVDLAGAASTRTGGVAGFEWITTGTGHDTIIGNEEANVIRSGHGRDNIRAGRRRSDLRRGR